MRILLLIVTLGLWPLWGAVVWVVAASMRYTGSQHDYWSGAPWLIVVAIPVSAVTSLISLVARFVFHNCDGGPIRRSILAGMAYAGILLAIYALSGVDWLREFGLSK